MPLSLSAAMPWGKRETGESPVRTRHCNQSAQIIYVTGKPGRRFAQAFVSQETCLLFGTGISSISDHEELIVPSFTILLLVQWDFFDVYDENAN